MDWLVSKGGPREDGCGGRKVATWCRPTPIVALHKGGLNITRRRFDLRGKPVVQINPTVPNDAPQLRKSWTSAGQAKLFEVLSRKLKVCCGGRGIKEVGIDDR